MRHIIGFLSTLFLASAGGPVGLLLGIAIWIWIAHAY